MIDKEKAELLNLRKRVQNQRSEILRLTNALREKLQAAMTIYDLWSVTTNDIYLMRGDLPPLKLPTGGRLQAEHAELEVTRIEIRKCASEAPRLLVWTRDPD